MSEFVANVVGQKLELALSDDNGQTTTARLDKYEVMALLVALTDAAQLLPGDPKAPIFGQQPVLRSSDPSFQVGVAENGNAVLAIRPEPFPPMEFYFPQSALVRLISDLRDVAAIPEDARNHQKPH